MRKSGNRNINDNQMSGFSRSPEDLIKEALVIEQEYIPGSWENFRRKRSLFTRRKLMFRYSSMATAAAVILLFLWVSLGDTGFPLNVVKSPLNTLDGTYLNLMSSVDEASKNRVLTVLNENSAKGYGSPVRLTELQKIDAAREERLGSRLQKTSSVERSTYQLAVPDTDMMPRNLNAYLHAKSENIAEGRHNNLKRSDGNLKRSDGNLKVRDGNLNSEVSVKEKRVQFGLNISPGFNSASTSESASFNYSGGLNMDIKIAKNLSISTGLQLEHQNVETASRAERSAIPSSHTSATLTNFDIPVNITWDFLTTRSGKYYVSGGVSSLAYIDEQYTTTSYRQEVRAATFSATDNGPLTTYAVQNVETVNTTNVPPYSRVDIAGRVNLMLGYSYRLTPELNMHVEPYIKVPVSGLATRKMRYTSGGVTFKISF